MTEMTTMTEDIVRAGGLVKEAEEMKCIVRETIADVSQDASSANSSEAARTARARTDKFRHMIERYKEQSTLLDPHLKDMIVPLASSLKTLAHSHLYGEATDVAGSLTRVVRICRLLHMITTVRGYKTVKKFYPSAPEDVEPAFYLLESLRAASDARSSDDYDETTLNSFWESHCTLLLWLSLLVLIPFDLATIDSGGQGKSIVHKILDTGRVFLRNAGLVRDMSAYLLSQLLTRPDNAGVLKDFLEWSQANLAKDGATQAADVFLILGISSTIAAIFKHGSRVSLLAIAPLAWQVIETLDALPESKNNSLIRKLRCKLLCRVGLVNLKPRLALWRYSLGSRTTDLSGGASGAAPNQPHQAAAAKGEEYVEDEEDIDCIEEIEELVGSFLENLCDKDTIVRWSAAKGIGRISNRLPRDMIADIIDSVLELFSRTETDCAWHGGCLALAELAWRGLLLPQHLTQVIPKVVEALQYDVKKGAHSVGSHVRDAACFVFWSFSRSYSSEIMGAYLPTIAKSLLVLSCFDREINCRRAASAAFQELVGRQGKIPHGIEALTIADYFTVSARKSAYLTVAPKIASFEVYSAALADHLLDSKVFHWEKILRELAAKALAALLPKLGPSFAHKALSLLFQKTSDPELDVRHGSIVTLAELLPVMSECGHDLQDEEVAKLAALVDTVSDAKFYRGKGGTIIYEAACSLLDGICRAGVTFPDEAVITKIETTIAFSLRHLSMNVQDCAVTAFKSLCGAYYKEMPLEAQIERTAAKYMDLVKRERSPLLCQGYLLALGSCPARILWSASQAVLECLKGKAIAKDKDDASDVEARVAAVKAMASMCRTLNDSLETEDQAEALAGLLVSDLIPCLLVTIDDYTIDNRGDIGSWVRHETMEAMEVALSALGSVSARGAAAASAAEAASLVTQVVGALIKQSLEKIDRIRHAAYFHTRKVLAVGALEPKVKCWADLQDIYRPFAEDHDKSNLFDTLLPILRLEPYRAQAIQGLALSAGGLGDSVSQTAVSALVRSTKEGGKDLLLAVAWALETILTQKAGTSRVVVPVMRTMDFLFSKADLVNQGDASLFDAILTQAWASTRGCRDIVQLQAALSLIANLSYAKEPTFSKSLYKLIAALVNRYPKIRRCAAEHLYMRIISFEEEEEDKYDVDRATELVTEVRWDTGSAESIKSARLDLFACFGMDPPKKVEKTKVKVAKAEGAMTSYASLVNAAGY